MEQHIYTSAKGTFLSYHEWVALNGTPEEKTHYESQVDSDINKALYAKWVKAEQILTHKSIAEDGTERVFPPPADA